MTKGYVYLLKSSTGYWKIGKTTNPKDRLRTFGVMLPFEVDYEHLISCYNMDKMEYDLHQIFREQRKRGEWFFLLSNDVRWIKGFISQTDFEGYCRIMDERNAESANILRQLPRAKSSFNLYNYYEAVLSAIFISCMIAAATLPAIKESALPFALFMLMSVCGGIAAIVGRVIRNADTQPMPAVNRTDGRE